MIVITAMTGHVKYDTERTVINLYYPAWEIWGEKRLRVLFGLLRDPPQLNAWMNRFEISSLALTFTGWLIDCVDGVTELSKVLILNVSLSILIKHDRHSAGWNFKNRFATIQSSICFNIYSCSEAEVRWPPPSDEPNDALIGWFWACRKLFHHRTKASLSF